MAERLAWSYAKGAAQIRIASAGVRLSGLGSVRIRAKGLDDSKVLNMQAGSSSKLSGNSLCKRSTAL